MSCGVVLGEAHSSLTSLDDISLGAGFREPKKTYCLVDSHGLDGLVLVDNKPNVVADSITTLLLFDAFLVGGVNGEVPIR